jgi:hypothetical protein
MSVTIGIFVPLRLSDAVFARYFRAMRPAANA